MLSLRPVLPDDRELLYRIYAGTRAGEMALLDKDEAWKREFLDQQCAAQDRHYRHHYPGARLDLILEDEEPIGRLYVARWEEEIRIMDIALLPEHRNRGIGSYWIAELLREAAESAKSLSIHVERYNPALGLYQRLGFRTVEDKGVYLLLEAKPE